MPHIAITMVPGRTQEQKQGLAERVQTFIMDELDLPATVVSVSVQDIPVDKWAQSMDAFSKEILLVKSGV